MRIFNKTKLLAVILAIACLLSVFGVQSGAIFGETKTYSVDTVDTADESSFENVSLDEIADKITSKTASEVEATDEKKPETTQFITTALVETSEDSGFIAPEETEYVDSHYHVTGFKEIDLDKLFPDGFIADTSWDPLGTDDNGIVYFGFTGRRTDLIAGSEIEDFAVMYYDPQKDVIKFIGTFIEACRAAGNYVEGEAIPKGHTKFYCIDGMMYMASQSFHDFKDKIDGDKGYLTYRGAHLFKYDIAKGVLIDVSANFENGVWVEHQGVVSMNYMPEIGKLVGLTHPLSDLVFFDLETQTVDRYAEGIPWTLGNPLSREMIVVGDKVYLYRGVEDTGYYAAKEWPVYCYDYGDDTLTKTGDTMHGGFWNGQATTSDGKTTYISGCCSELYKMDRATGKVTFLRDMDRDGENVLGYTYSISLTPDETKLIYIPTARNPGYIYEYDIATNTVTTIASVPNCIYCGNNIVVDDWYYFTRFGKNGSWERYPTLIAYKLEK